MKISIIGLGKLGAVLAAVLAEAGHTVVGIDINERSVSLVNKGVAPVDETDLQALYDDQPPGTLTATTDFAAVAGTEITMVVVPTPSTEDGTFSSTYVEEAVAQIGAHLVKGQWHTTVICSTLTPGTMDDVIRPLLAETSGQIVSIDIGLCYSPEFIALGSVIRDMQRPDAILVGSRDHRSALHLRELVESYVQTKPAFHNLTFAEAELAKIAVNAFVTMKISYANSLAELTEQFHGASAARVLAAVGSDSRIGHAYLRPGASFGGPCFPRDNRALAGLARAHGLTADLAEATDRANERVVDRVTRMLGPFDRVAILGLSYKPATSVVEESLGLAVATNLAAAGVTVTVHDPQAVTDLPDGVERHVSAFGAFQDAGVVLVATPWPEYAHLNFGCRVLVDAWNITMPQANRHVLGDYYEWTTT